MEIVRINWKCYWFVNRECGWCWNIYSENRGGNSFFVWC